ncbi:discoidin domain-containing protein [Spirillospora sp. NPDC047418]
MSATETCDDCGAHGQSGAFCDVCGAVLDWRDRTPAPGPSLHPHGAEATTEPLPDATPPAGRTAPAVDAADPPAPPTAAAGTGASGTGPVGTGAAGTTLPSEDEERARRLLVPVPTRERSHEVPPAVTPVLPGRPEEARPQVRTVTEPEPLDLAGGVVCPWCDTANPRGRRFCRQCAMSLAELDRAGSRAKRPWWKFYEEPDREQPWAGDRPRLRRGMSRLVVVIPVALLTLGLGVFSVANAGTAVNGVIDHFAKRVSVSPSQAKASHSQPGNGPDKAFDGFADSYWGVGYSGAAHGQWIEAGFAQPRRLLNVVITPGISRRLDTQRTQGRPQTLEATVFSSDGKSRTRELQFDDAVGPQKFKLRGEDVVRVRFTIRASYGTVRKDQQVAIAEIEFFGRSVARTL